MHFFATLMICVIAAVPSLAEDQDTCFSETSAACDKEIPADSEAIATDLCTAKYSKINKERSYMEGLNNYANENLHYSMKYLLMATKFGSLDYSREGFEKLFRKLSDETWDDAIDLMKYITLRGGNATIGMWERNVKEDRKPLNHSSAIYNVPELQSLALALDIQKSVATRAHELHHKIGQHDPQVASYLERKFLHKHAKTIRDLAGYYNDLYRLAQDTSGKSVMLQYFVMDEYLKESL